MSLLDEIKRYPLTADGRQQLADLFYELGIARTCSLRLRPSICHAAERGCDHAARIGLRLPTSDSLGQPLVQIAKDVGVIGAN